MVGAALVFCLACVQSGPSPGSARVPEADNQTTETRSELPAAAVASPVESPSAASWTPPVPARWALAGGARALFLEQPGEARVALRLVLPRGAATDPLGQAGLTHLVARLLAQGAGSRDASAVTERLASLSIDYEAVTTVDSIVLAMDLPAEHFEAAAELLADLALRPSLEVASFERAKAELLAEVTQAEADPRAARRIAVQRALYGRGYAGQPSRGTSDTVSSIRLADVRAHHARLAASSGVTVAVVGSLPRKQVRQQLERSFAALGDDEPPVDKPITSSAASGKLYVIDYPGAPSAALAVARRAPGGDDDSDFFAASVFDRVLSTRLQAELGAIAPAAPGVQSAFRRFRSSGYFVVTASVVPDSAAVVLRGIFSQLRATCGSRPISESERSLAVEALLAEQRTRFEGLPQLAARLTAIAVHDWPLDWHAEWPKRIAAVTPQAVGEAAATYCERAELSVVVAGPRAALGAVEELGFDVIALDVRGRRP